MSLQLFSKYSQNVEWYVVVLRIIFQNYRKIEKNRSQTNQCIPRDSLSNIKGKKSAKTLHHHKKKIMCRTPCEKMILAYSFRLSRIECIIIVDMIKQYPRTSVDTVHDTRVLVNFRVKEVLPVKVNDRWNTS